MRGAKRRFSPFTKNKNEGVDLRGPGPDPFLIQLQPRPGLDWIYHAMQDTEYLVPCVLVRLYATVQPKQTNNKQQMMIRQIGGGD